MNTCRRDEQLPNFRRKHGSARTGPQKTVNCSAVTQRSWPAVAESVTSRSAGIRGGDTVGCVEAVKRQSPPFFRPRRRFSPCGSASRRSGTGRGVHKRELLNISRTIKAVSPPFQYRHRNGARFMSLISPIKGGREERSRRQRHVVRRQLWQSVRNF